MRKTPGLKRKVRDYRNAFGRYGVNPGGLYWTTRKAQQVRFRQLLKDVDLEGKSILDVGCGFAEIIPHIRKKAKNFDYLGIDAVSEFVQVSKNSFPEYEFIKGDYYGKPLKRHFDIILTSGTLNSNIKRPMDFRKAAIRIMFDHAKEAVLFNMAGGHPQPKNKKSYRIWYADSLEVLNYCFSLTSKLIFRHHYRKKDFTVILFK
jgi:SAM-dependent methyltransferase